KDEELIVYLSVANEAVSAVLLVERNKRQIPIHYVSRALQGAEINYSLMEKLVLALVHTARQLRREARRKQQVEKYYNQRVHHKQFKVGEFVLRKNELSKVKNTGKLEPNWEGPYEIIETYGTGAYKL
ncbi:reverse transcriptase domain-containing protein, partial [Tanacetum coccineum]